MKKKLIIGVTSLVLVAAMAIGGTLAFMTQKTATMTNTFTAAPGLSGEIREPLWDGYQFGETKTDNSQPDGTAAKTGITGDDLAALGITKANTMTPGLDIPKNPTLKNTSAVPVYMAIKVTYNDMTKFDAIASFTPNAGWVESSTGSGIYYYVGTDNNGNANTVLQKVAKDDGTTSLFNTVDIKTDATSTSLESNQFQITVVGGAVQTTDIDDNTAKAQLVTLLS